MLNGNDLIAWGFTPGNWFNAAIAAANDAYAESGEAAAREAVRRMAPPPTEMIPLRTETLPYAIFMDTYDDAEVENRRRVIESMDKLMKTPTVVAGACMPDACPSDVRLGYIPVGGVVATKDAIHPGMHSSDVCCSVAISYLPRIKAKIILDAAMRITHFGGGGRPRGQQVRPDSDLLLRMSENSFLKNLVSTAIEHHATQGDGNHFFFVGHSEKEDALAIVTHHGSRGLGAQLYKFGMKCAKHYRRKLSPETLDFNAWIPSETEAGEDYWNALQLVREWTKSNHQAIHNMLAEAVGVVANGFFWNEHNFVFRKSDGLFYHAKGATPAYPNYAADANGLTLIPLNMAEPVLVTRGLNRVEALGFAPHGAGRNFSRNDYRKENCDKTPEQMIAEQAPGIDVRYFSGNPDVTELPAAYKDAKSIRCQIQKARLAEIVDEIHPLGNIMAGDWQKDAPWKVGKKRNRD